MSPRAAVTAIFLINGLGIGSFAARLPAIQDRLDLSEGQLAVALAAIAAGALAGMPLAGRTMARRGSRTPTRYSVLGFAAALALIGAAPSFGLLVLVALLYGAHNGGLDVSMNAQGVAVERRSARAVLASMHAAWSVGGLIGAGAAAGAAAVGLDVRIHLLLAAALVAIAGSVAGRRLLPASADAPAEDTPAVSGRAIPRPARRRLFILGALAFASMLAEGAAADWSAVYVNQSLGSSEAVAALAFTAFTLAMTAARLVSDRLTTAFGPVAIARGGTAIAAAGLAAALLIGHPAAALAGFAALGLGLAPVVPVVFRAAGTLPGVAAGPALARTSATGYLGFLAGPPLIGGLAELTSLPVALGAVVLSVALAAVLAGAIAGAGGETADAPVPAPA